MRRKVSAQWVVSFQQIQYIRPPFFWKFEMRKLKQELILKWRKELLFTFLIGTSFFSRLFTGSLISRSPFSAHLIPLVPVSSVNALLDLLVKKNFRCKIVFFYRLSEQFHFKFIQGDGTAYCSITLKKFQIILKKNSKKNFPSFAF